MAAWHPSTRAFLIHLDWILLPFSSHSHTLNLFTSLVSPSPSQHLPLFCESMVTNHSGTHVWDARVTSALHSWVRMQISHRWSPAHISQHISCVNSVPAAESYTRKCFSANEVWFLSSLEEDGRRGSQSNTGRLSALMWQVIFWYCSSCICIFLEYLNDSWVASTPIPLLFPFAQQAFPSRCVNEVSLFGWECKLCAF